MSIQSGAAVPSTWLGNGSNRWFAAGSAKRAASNFRFLQQGILSLPSGVKLGFNHHHRFVDVKKK